VLNYLGYSWVDMNINLDDGLKMIRKAVDQRPSDGYIVDSLGWAYYRLGRYQDALTELQRAVSLKPEDPVLNDHLGDALWRVGRKLEATYQWRHASDMHPDAQTLASVQKKLAEGLPDKKVVVAQATGAAQASDAGKAADGTEKKVEAAPPANGDTPAKKAESGEKPAAAPATEPKAEPAAPAPDAGKAPTEAAGKEGEKPATDEAPKAEAPAAQAPAAEAPKAGEEPAGNGGEPKDNSYVVRSGQSLWSIAVEKLGNGALYREIVKQNPRLRGHPDLIQPGQVLKLPEKAD
jgi:nucleoid-associated protein YgaU